MKGNDKLFVQNEKGDLFLWIEWIAISLNCFKITEE